MIRSGALPDVSAGVPGPRDAARVRDLEVLERAFARGRRARVEATLHRETLARARVMMSSEQLKAFDVSQEPASLRAEYGDTPVRPRLPGRPPAHRGRRALRRGDPRRLGYARRQP